MAPADVELEQQLKETGKQLSRPPDSVDELLPVLDRLEKLLLKVDQSPKKSMLDALKPSMKALIQDGLSKHSDTDVKVAVASCISEITRITAPDAPYTDDQMKDVFQLIVSSFEGLSDQSSRSYHKRASILETVSKVRSCVIMLDLECDELIVKMFEHFLKSVRNFHLESVYASMENTMVLVIEESEDISAELLKPLLASVKKDRKGVLPVAHRLGKGVLLKSAEKLKPYMKQALVSLGESLNSYHKVVAAICDGTAANFEDNDDNDSGVEVANECKLEKGSTDLEQQVVKEKCLEEEVDPMVENKSAKSVMSNGVNVTLKEEASVDQESKKPVEEKSQEPRSKEETDDSDADKLAKEKSQTEKISEKSEEKADTVMSAADPLDSSQVEGGKEVEKDNDVKESETENEKDNVKESEKEKGKDNGVKELDNKKEKDSGVEVSETQNENDNVVKEPENEAVIPSETEKSKDVVQEVSPKATETKLVAPATATVSSPSQSISVPDESSVGSEKKPAPQEDEAASPSKTGSPPGETGVKNAGLPKDKGLTQEDKSEAQKQAGKETIIAKEEVQLADAGNKSEDGLAGSDSDAKPVRKSRSKSTKKSGKKSKQPAKKLDVGESDAKKPKQSGKKVDAKGESSDSDDVPLKMSLKKGEKSKIAVEEEQEHDSDDKPLKSAAKKSNSKKKDDVKKRASGKTVAEKDQAKSLSGDDEMDISPKSAKGEGDSAETPVTSAKRKRSTGKTEVSDTIKYDASLVGKKVKVWWPDDKMFYEGVITEFFPAKKRHKVSYVDGDEEKLNLKNERWEILQKFSARDVEEQNTDAQSEEASPEMKKKKSKTEPSASQEKTKDSAKRAVGASSSGKSKASTQKSGGKSSDPAATTSKEAGKSKEAEETPKTSAKTKTVNKSKVKTPPTGSKSNTNGPTKGKSGSPNVKEPEDAKSNENTKGGGSKSGKKRKKT